MRGILFLWRLKFWKFVLSVVSRKKSESVCLKYDFSVGDNEDNDNRYNNIKRKDNSHTTQKLKLSILSVKLEYNQIGIIHKKT